MDDAILRRREVEKRTGLCRSAIYNGIAQGTFPKPIRIGPRSSGWVASEISAWIAERVRERDAQKTREAA